MASKEALASIVGQESFFDDLETLDVYSKDESFVAPMKPRMIVKPKSVNEIQEIVRWANQTNTPLVPVSSGPPHFRGDTVPSVPGAVILDLSEMKQIIRIDRRNRMAMIEPGVTYSQLQPELAKEGMRVSTPLLPRHNKSVIASLLERESLLNPRIQWSLTDPLRCVEVIWGNGEKLWTGEAGAYGELEEQWKMGLAQVSSAGPGQTDFYRFVSAAQGSMGIVSKASAKCEILPRLQKLLLAPAKELGDLLGFAYRLLRLRYGDELLILNGSNLACILGETADQIKTLKETLPQWVLIVGIAGRDWLPKERVEFQEKDIRDIARQYNVHLEIAVPGASGEQVLDTLSRPSKDPHWKLGYQGGCQDIFFLTMLNKTPEFVGTIYSLAEARGYSPSEIGIYIQPVQQGVSCHCEFSLPYDPRNKKEVAKIQQLLTDGSEALIQQGAFFSRPYNVWADMVYCQDTQSAAVLKKIKEIFDPNKILNPGKLCF